MFWNKKRKVDNKKFRKTKSIENQKKTNTIKMNKTEKTANSTVSTKIINKKKSQTTKKIIKESFKDFSKIPNNAIVVSNNPKSDYFIDDKRLREDFLILESFYAPNGFGDQKQSVIFIFTSALRAKVDIMRFRQKAKEDGKLFVIDTKETAKQFIKEFMIKDEEKEKKEEKEEKGNRKRIKELIEDAIEQKASDLHIEVGEQTVLRIRVNGEISEFDAYRDGAILNKETGYIFARTIYNSYTETSGGLAFNDRTPQDALGVLSNVHGQTVRIRIATAPTQNGFDMVMRMLIIKQDAQPLTLKQLGYRKKQEKLIKSAISMSRGVTIIAGTTNSGKSTSLVNILLDEISKSNGNIKIITVEDPPEFGIRGATQIPVIRDDDGDGKTAFKKAIKAALRLDPNIIMVGEVRDEQTAELLVEAAQTGHKVLTTLHTGSALGIIYRLNNLGVSLDVLAGVDFLNALIYQKLFPVLCDYCCVSLKNGYIPVKYSLDNILLKYNYVTKTEIKKVKSTFKGINIVRLLQDNGMLSVSSAETVFKLFENANDKFENENMIKRISSIAGDLTNHNIRFRGEGCSRCRAGYKGQTIVSEVVVPDMKLLELITTGKATAIYKYWIKNLGGVTIVEDAYEKMLNGIISPKDIENTFGPISQKIQ